MTLEKFEKALWFFSPHTLRDPERSCKSATVFSPGRRRLLHTSRRSDRAPGEQRFSSLHALFGMLMLRHVLRNL